jgi:hypothetical protein
VTQESEGKGEKIKNAKEMNMVQRTTLMRMRMDVRIRRIKLKLYEFDNN